MRRCGCFPSKIRQFYYFRFYLPKFNDILLKIIENERTRILKPYSTQHQTIGE